MLACNLEVCGFYKKVLYFEAWLSNLKPTCHNQITGRKLTKLPLSFGLTRLPAYFSLKEFQGARLQRLKKTKEQKAIDFLSYRSSPFTQENWLTMFVLAANKQKAALSLHAVV